MTNTNVGSEGNIYNTNPDQYNAIRDERNKPKETQSLDASINNNETNENKKPFDYDKELDELEKFNPNKDQQLTNNNDDVQNTSDNRDNNDKTTEETSGEQKTFIVDCHATLISDRDGVFNIYNEISDIDIKTLKQMIADSDESFYKFFIKNESRYELVSIIDNHDFLKEHFKGKYERPLMGKPTYSGTSEEFINKLKELNITVAEFKRKIYGTFLDIRHKYPNSIMVIATYDFPRKKTISERVNDSFGKWFK